MPYEFKPDPKGKGKSKYVGGWAETSCQLIPLPFTSESLRQLLKWGEFPDTAPYTHQEIAHWCDKLHMEFFDTDDTSPEMDSATSIATDVECQWDLYLVNTYSLQELQQLEFSKVRLPTEWFSDWLSQLN